ncbi:MAG: helix-turn-helix transcriptional regulator [Thermoplasmata archaeon]|nr:MAG: helix-turn-helix transcriptional regulator [Thermoplasmata archaeon]
MNKKELCPVEETIKLIGKKWYLMIINELMKNPRRFNELKNSIEGISSKVLSDCLTTLVQEELVHRRVFSEAPIKVEYSLTEKGRDLNKIFKDMDEWGTKWVIC